MNRFFNATYFPFVSQTLHSVWQKIAFLITLMAISWSATAQLATKDDIERADSLEKSASIHSYPLYFKTVTDTNLVDAIGYLDGKSLRNIPLSSITNGLTGRLAGLVVKQDNGEPGNYGSSITLRNREPLVLVDGIPRDLSSMMTDHIESVTVLKDALATAALGIRGANGAVLITTRKQAEKDGFNIDFSANAGVAEPLKVRQQLPAWQYALLYNEALANDGRMPKYSETDIDALKSGNSSFLHPDNDWNKLVLKNSSPFQRYVLNAEGRSDAVSYFLSGDYMSQKGLLNGAEENTYSTNLDYSRLGLRGNVAVALTPKTSLALNMYVVNQKRIVPGGTPSFGFGANTNRISVTDNSIENLFGSVLNTPGNAYPIFNPDGSLGGNQLFTNNIWGQLTRSGYSQTNVNDGTVDFIIKRDMSDVWKNWWLQGDLSYTMTIINTLVRTKGFPTYEMKINPTSSDTTYRQFGTLGEQSNSSTANIRNGSLFLDLATGWSTQWNDQSLDLGIHYQYSNARYASQLPFVIQNAFVQAAYQIGNRFVFNAVTAYSGNNWYKEGYRYEFYPAGGVSWNIHNEDFFGEHRAINRLRLRASYGLTGNLDANYFSYMYTYNNYGSAYYFGASPGAVDGLTENQLPYIRTAEKTLKFNLGADIALFADRFNLSADYYRDKAYDQLQVRGGNTALLGSSYPNENIGKVRYSGLELTAGWQDKGRTIGYFITGNVAFTNTKILFNDQQQVAYPWMGTQGQRLGQIYGYIADGFVTTAGEGPVVEGYQSVPGDLKYKDLNGDGVINFYDQTNIGPDRPMVTYGVHVGLSVKGFDLSALFSGMTNRVVSLTGAGEWEFQNNGKAAVFPQHLNRWTSETAATATYPRLTVGTNPNNHVNSTFWLQSADFIRLSTAEIGYTFTAKALQKVNISSIRLFASGFNLLTFGGNDRFDPETLSYGYPIQRLYNGGITVKF